MKVYLHWRQIRAKDAAGAIARRVLVRQASRWRRRRWTGEQPTDPSSMPDDGLDTEIDDIARVEVFQRALMALPAAQRAVLVLRYFELHTEAEIAEILRIPAGTVKSRAARAITALRDAGVHIEDQNTEVEQQI
jgi:RNA polymerase sigma factor (sigma-70 family)